MITESILLRPRPYALHSGSLLLLPLLPHKSPMKSLPTELWIGIFSHVLNDDMVDASKRKGSCNPSCLKLSLLTVCKTFTEVVLRLLYAKVRISILPSFEKFARHLRISDLKWDSIRRIPYSTPGRWVHNLDLSALAFTSRSEALLFDSLLTKLFPVIPFLTQFTLNPSFVLSVHALESLKSRDGAINLQLFEGIGYAPLQGSVHLIQDDPLVQLLRCCPNLRQLEIIGHGVDYMGLELVPAASDSEPSLPMNFTPLTLLHLRVMTILSLCSSPLLLSLLLSPLPSLRKLTITPYNDIPYPASLVSQFIETHGEFLHSLLLFTPKSWPTRLHPSPETLLHTSPNVRHLSLEKPVPLLTLPLCPYHRGPHPLQILSIPRPTVEIFQMIRRLLPELPFLKAVRTRDVRWLRGGITSRALEAGVQGEMREWGRWLGRKGIRLVDADWKGSRSIF